MGSVEEVGKPALLERLRQGGYRLTKQRLAVLNALAEAGGHSNVHEIYMRVQPKAPGMSLATVYRTISMLLGMGIIEEVNLPDGCTLYELSSGKAHYHFTCTRCGRIFEVEFPEIDRFTNRLEGVGHKVYSVWLGAWGMCSDCASNDQGFAGERHFSQHASTDFAVPLSRVPSGSAVKVVNLQGGHGFVSRMLALGLVPGACGLVLQNRGRGPVLVRFGDVRVALGRGEAERVIVRLTGEDGQGEQV